VSYQRRSKKGRLTIVKRANFGKKVGFKNPIPPGTREILKRSLIPYNTFDPNLRPTQRKYREKSNLVWAPSYLSTLGLLAL
jgi:hypothetical protein